MPNSKSRAEVKNFYQINLAETYAAILFDKGQRSIEA